MSSSSFGLSLYDETKLPNVQSWKFGIVVSEWNHKITENLLVGCKNTLMHHGAKAEDLITFQVPGSFELPAGATILSSKYEVDAIICLGCLIKGDTAHDEYIANAVANGLTRLSISLVIPCIFGVLTVLNEQQALDRSGGKYGNKGVEAAVTAIRMASLKREM
ncbi:MAG: 6,7-dimethyl-8-ribityllumazine synthase [Bacteroidota bacterium]